MARFSLRKFTEPAPKTEEAIMFVHKTTFGLLNLNALFVLDRLTGPTYQKVSTYNRCSASGANTNARLTTGAECYLDDLRPVWVRSAREDTQRITRPEVTSVYDRIPRSEYRTFYLFYWARISNRHSAVAIARDVREARFLLSSQSAGTLDIYLDNNYLQLPVDDPRAAYS